MFSMIVKSRALLFINLIIWITNVLSIETLRCPRLGSKSNKSVYSRFLSCSPQQQHSVVVVPMGMIVQRAHTSLADRMVHLNSLHFLYPPADIFILARNPLTLHPSSIRSIQVSHAESARWGGDAHTRIHTRSCMYVCVCVRKVTLWTCFSSPHHVTHFISFWWSLNTIVESWCCLLAVCVPSLVSIVINQSAYALCGCACVSCRSLPGLADDCVCTCACVIGKLHTHTVITRLSNSRNHHHHPVVATCLCTPPLSSGDEIAT